MTKHEIKRGFHNRMESLVLLHSGGKITTSKFINRVDTMFSNYIERLTSPSDPNAMDGLPGLAGKLENLASAAESDLGMPVILTPDSTKFIARALRKLVDEVDRLDEMEQML